MGMTAASSRCYRCTSPPPHESGGIDLYDRTRLDEEGVNNVEGLAHADIVDLMSSTRISAAQLVDWTDQVILYLHGGDAAPGTSGDPHPEVPSSPLDRSDDRRADNDPPTSQQAERRPAGVRRWGVVGAADERGLRRLAVMRNVCHLRPSGSARRAIFCARMKKRHGAGESGAELLHSAPCTNGTSGKDQTSVTAKEIADYELVEVAALRKALEFPDAPTGGPVR